MARLALCVLALLVAGTLSSPERSNVSPKLVDPVFVQRQVDLMILFFHLHEPNHPESWKQICNSWSLEKNIEHFSNVTAVSTYIEMLEHKWVLPRAVPFSVLESAHKFEAVTLYNILYSAKDYDSFYKAAVYLRERVNENLFAYVLGVVILNRPDTQGIYIPRLHEVFPSYYYNGEILTTAQRINTHGHRLIESYPSTYKWDNNVVIRWNDTIWPYSNSYVSPVGYFTNDIGLNTYYYNYHLAQPSWLHSEVLPLNKVRRGEWLWFVHQQMLARYYMERLSNGLGEIPELGHEIVKEGYNPGLLYHNGIAFPVRPDYYHLDQPLLVHALQKIDDYERRVRDAIEQGYVLNHLGEHIDISSPEGIEILGNVIAANADSPNLKYYNDFISLWKKVLGNSIVHEHQYHHHVVPLVVPSALEHYQTALRDPAFYMIWKRVLGLFQLWQEKLPPYKREELALPQVAIQKVDVDKLVSFFEYTYRNVSAFLHMNEEEAKEFYDQESVLVQYPRLNHKKFQVRVHVKSEVAKSVLVKFFLAPKYDSHGFEIPLHVNSQNFLQFDEFVYDLPAGESVIARDSIDTSKVWDTANNVYYAFEKSLHGDKQFNMEQVENMESLVQHLVLPKGRVGGMPFVLMVYISEYRAPKVHHEPSNLSKLPLGLTVIAGQLTDGPLGFPVNRPLYPWQVKGVKNLYFQDVLVHHKHTPEIVVPHTE
ncbi:acidic juvenile hormone-suppressible protein 1-like [Spodoptera litura]|uniref:Acidic juvenile hormone-suppressible protein 1-like n=1 Tax=Spodoptera litura TaxID=69820 RepID=A0A9J7E309_SPOLT|nr:acidic juvenile hormone-suppressible protein 1-like [Spodoptera litura]